MDFLNWNGSRKELASGKGGARESSGSSERLKGKYSVDRTAEEKDLKRGPQTFFEKRTALKHHPRKKLSKKKKGENKRTFVSKSTSKGEGLQGR